MRHSRDRCLFCLSEKGPFDRDEHPIPESLGNNELLLPRGVVCDFCNQYFGTKLEKRILSLPPFSFVRVALNVRNQRGRVPPSSHGQHYTLRPTGFRDVVILTGQQSILDAASAGEVIPLPSVLDEDWIIA